MEETEEVVLRRITLPEVEPPVDVDVIGMEITPVLMLPVELIGMLPVLIGMLLDTPVEDPSLPEVEVSPDEAEAFVLMMIITPVLMFEDVDVDPLTRDEVEVKGTILLLLLIFTEEVEVAEDVEFILMLIAPVLLTYEDVNVDPPTRDEVPVKGTILLLLLIFTDEVEVAEDVEVDMPIMIIDEVFKFDDIDVDPPIRDVVEAGDDVLVLSLPVIEIIEVFASTEVDVDNPMMLTDPEVSEFDEADVPSLIFEEVDEN